jgi:DNA-binding PadR family transcriptional regulator
MAAHTDLDFSVLGVIARAGPLTAYGVRQEFAASASPAWSSSAGSIYPAIRRLQTSGLVTSERPSDGRGRQELTITAVGEAALRGWLLDIGPAIGAPTPDPIRTRSQFLDPLSSAERRAFFDRCIEATKAGLDFVQSKALGEHLGEQIGVDGAVAQLRARLTWLERCKRNCDGR